MAEMTLEDWQRGLVSLGYDLGRGGRRNDGVDGVFGRLTSQATVAFKRSAGLSATPTIGPKSVAAMQAALARRTGQAIPAAPAKGLDPVWIIEGRRYLGIREVAGPSSNATILGWARRLGDRVLGMAYRNDDVPWCGLYVAAIIAAVLSAEPLPAVVVRASAWDAFGRKLSRSVIMFGAVVRFQRPGGGHVGFAVGVSADGKLVRVLGGNQSNRVSETWIERDRLVEQRWPSTVNAEPTPAPIMNATGSVVSRNEA